jgi:2-alkyl-3-oxoalkanoate reductase
MTNGKINVVTGATGQLGSHIAAQLRAAGETVRALVRAPSKADFLVSQGVEVVEGDVRDPTAARDRKSTRLNSSHP